MATFKHVEPPRALSAEATTLALWHDLGGAISYPTDQWFGRVIGAVNTHTAPDLINNNYERVIRIQAQTGKMVDLKPVLEALPDRGFLGSDDLQITTYQTA